MSFAARHSTRASSAPPVHLGAAEMATTAAQAAGSRRLGGLFLYFIDALLFIYFFRLIIGNLGNANILNLEIENPVLLLVSVMCIK